MKKDKSSRQENGFSEGQVAVLLEEIRSQQKAIFEGQEFIKSKIESLETNQARIWEKVTQIDLSLIKVEKEIIGMKDGLGRIEKRLDILEGSPR